MIIRSPPALEDLLRWKAQGTPESEVLDFKRTWGPWCDYGAKEDAKEEAAKDIAAFANHRGGHIVVGAQEDEKRIKEWVSVDGVKPTDLLIWLDTYLVPRGVAGTISITPFQVEEGVTVVVVTVPPWPHDVVAVRYNVGKRGPSGPTVDKAAYGFPFRFADETRFWSWEEVMQRSDAKARSMQLKLLAATAAGPRQVRLSRSVEHVTHNGSHKPGEVCRLSSTDVRDGDFTLHITLNQGYSDEIRLNLPMSAIREVWEGSESPAMLHLAHGGTIFFENGVMFYIPEG
jgi:hypothetical protein